MVSWIYNAVEKVWEGVWTKTGENLADAAVGTGVRVLDFETGLKSLRRNSTMLCSVQSDVLTKVESEELSGRKKRKRVVEEWLEGNKRIQEDVFTFELQARQHKLKSLIICATDQVEKLNKRVEKQIQWHEDFGDEPVLEDHQCRGEKLLLGELYGDTFRKNLDRIFDCIKAGTQIITIFGDDGAGKMTLAKHVHNKVLEETENRVYWVCVSEKTTVKKLQDDISNAIHLNLENVTNEDRRAARLHEALKKKANFVLMLINLKEYVDLEMVGFPIGVAGCQLVITTCSLRVCKRIVSGETFEVKMDEEKAWDIFKEAYGQGELLNWQQEEYVKLAVINPGRIVELAMSMKREGVLPGSREWRHQLEEVEGFF